MRYFQTWLEIETDPEIIAMFSDSQDDDESDDEETEYDESEYYDDL